jgi:hypothetical protein
VGWLKGSLLLISWAAAGSFRTLQACVAADAGAFGLAVAAPGLRPAAPASPAASFPGFLSLSAKLPPFLAWADWASFPGFLSLSAKLPPFLASFCPKTQL